jgi:hypothetical protein
MGGAGRIPWSKAMKFAATEGIHSKDEQDRFWRLMGAMDGAYLEWLAESQKVDPKKKD